MSQAQTVVGVGPPAGQAMRAAGAVVHVDAPHFLSIVRRQDAPLVVFAVETGLLRMHFKYLTSYKGLTFFARSPHLLDLPPGVESVAVQSIWVPDSVS